MIPANSSIATQPSPVESLKVNIDSYQAHYLKSGNGLPIVLLHGGASDSQDWLQTMSSLSHRFSLYAPDLVGYGESDKSKSRYYLADFVEFTVQFIQTLALDRPVLAGHSLGGRMALEIALKYPDKLSRLILIDTLGFGRMSRFGSTLSTLAWGVRKLRNQHQPYPVLAMGEGENAGWVCLKELPGLNAPTLIVWKRCDPYFPLAVATRAKKLIPEARLAVLPGWGHAPHKEPKSPFNQLLLDYLEHDST